MRLGALTQVTAGSITGRFGPKARDFAHALLARGLVHVIASDSHDARHRPPTLSEGMRAAAELVGEAAARRMVLETPQGAVTIRSHRTGLIAEAYRGGQRVVVRMGGE